MHFNMAFMSFDDPGTNGQAEAGSLLIMGAGFIGPVEAIENPLGDLRRKSNALVRNGKASLVVRDGQADLYRPAGVRILHRIVDDVQ